MPRKAIGKHFGEPWTHLLTQPNERALKREALVSFVSSKGKRKSWKYWRWMKGIKANPATKQPHLSPTPAKDQPWLGGRCVWEQQRNSSMLNVGTN